MNKTTSITFNVAGQARHETESDVVRRISKAVIEYTPELQVAMRRERFNPESGVFKIRLTFEKY